MKTYRFLLILLVVIIALPFAGRLLWIIKSSKPLDIIIINKSVEKSTQNEVKAINWTLNNQKFVTSLGDSYDFNYSYFGYYPEGISEERKIKSFTLENISSLSEKNSALFYADNTGIVLNQNDPKSSKAKGYFGFNNNDYILLKEMVNRQKLVIAEYNFISSPTEDLVRYNTEQFLDFYALGWVGKYFKDLSQEKISGLISSTWFDLYKQTYSSDWNFSGPGIILLNSGQNRIIILPSEKYSISEYPTVITSPEIASEYGIPQNAAYTGWFDMAYQGNNRVLSHFNLNLNTEGIDLLKKNGIESEFPAVIESQNKKFYYIAGDFSKVDVVMATSRLAFISEIIKNLNKSKTENPDKFFQVYYDYLLSGIFNNYYNEISQKVR
jgi:hypothetical protein